MKNSTTNISGNSTEGLSGPYLERQLHLMETCLALLNRQADALTQEDGETVRSCSHGCANLTKEIQAVQRCLDALPPPAQEPARRAELLQAIFTRIEENRAAMRAASATLRNRLKAQRHPGLGPRSIYATRSPSMIDISY